MRQINDVLTGPTDWDVLFIQEHNLDSHKIQEVRRTFLPQGDTTWWEADETRGGVAITLHKKAGMTVIEEGQDPEGRFGWLIVKRGQEVFGLCNVYSSCEERERRLMWGRLTSKLNSSYRSRDFWGGYQLCRADV